MTSTPLGIHLTVALANVSILIAAFIVEAFANGITQDFTEQSRPLVSALAITKTSTSASLMNLGFGYDATGNQTRTTDALALGYARSASYDGFDRILSNSNTGTGGNVNESFTYAAANVGDLQTKTGATFTYNAVNRLLASVTGATAAGNRNYAYDSYGNATSDGRFSFVFDALNSLRQINQSAANGASNIALYDYDGHQHLAKKVSPEGTTHYLYGKNGRLYGEYSTRYLNDAPINKQKEYVFLGNKRVGQWLSLTVPPVVYGCGFNADAIGADEAADPTSDGLLITRFNRGLAGAALVAGARLDQTPANLPNTNANVTAHMDAYAAAHDLDGNGSVNLADALIITRYLAGFRGIALTSGLTLSGIRSNSSAIEAYIAQDCPNAGTSASTETLSYLHPNVSGSPIMATDAFGSALWREDYLAFGEKTKYEASVNQHQNFFIGKPTDATTGLVYFGARWYDPAVARFLSFDPAPVDDANPHSFNRYSYGNNNPNKFLDPDGRDAKSIVATAVKTYADKSIFSPEKMAAIEAASAAMRAAEVSGDPVAKMDAMMQGAAVLGVTMGVVGKAGAGVNPVATTARTTKVEPIKSADGPHTTWKVDPQTGFITRHETWTQNSKNPTGWDSRQSTDVTGRAHINRDTKQAVPTPHTQGKNIPGSVRPAQASEIPKGSQVSE